MTGSWCFFFLTSFINRSNIGGIHSHVIPLPSAVSVSGCRLAGPSHQNSAVQQRRVACFDCSNFPVSDQMCQVGLCWRAEPSRYLPVPVSQPRLTPAPPRPFASPPSRCEGDPPEHHDHIWSGSSPRRQGKGGEGRRWGGTPQHRNFLHKFTGLVERK